MEALYLVLFLIAAILFVLDAFLVRPAKVSLLALGLFFFVLPFLIQEFDKL